MAVMAHQTVEVMPNSKYRLTGWIRTQVEVPPLAAAQSATELSADASPNAAVPTTPVAPAAGACFGIIDRDDNSEMVTGTREWIQVTWEFETGDSTTLTLGCQLGTTSTPCAGTAWFDDLVLERLPQ